MSMTNNPAPQPSDDVQGKLRKETIKPSFSDIVDLVRQRYLEGFGLKIGYAEAAKYVDEAIAPYIHQEVRTVLDRLEKQAETPPGYVEVKVVHLSAIAAEKGKYE